MGVGSARQVSEVKSVASHLKEGDSVAQRSTLRIVQKVPRIPNPEALVKAIEAGDEKAFARFYEVTSGLLFGLLLRILGETSTADEVLLEIYAEVRQHAAQFDKDREGLLAWLITITHRRALEHLCSSTEDQQFLVSVGLAKAPDSGRARRFSISKSAHRRLVNGTLNALSPAEQKIIELTYFSRMTPLGIATELRQTPDAVRTGLQYGVSHLHKLFNSQGFLSEA